MKKIKEQHEDILSAHNQTQEDEENPLGEDSDFIFTTCKKCDNIDCKCGLIMESLQNCIELSEQIGHNELYNILLTIFAILENMPTHGDELFKIMETCQSSFEQLRPKEMGKMLN